MRDMGEVFVHSFEASKAPKVSFQKRELRRIGYPRCRQNLHRAVARKRFGSQNYSKLACSEHFLNLSSAQVVLRARERLGSYFWKFSFAKFAPRCGARAMWKLKPLKTNGFGAVLAVQNAFRVTGTMIFDTFQYMRQAQEACKNVARRGKGPK